MLIGGGAQASQLAWQALQQSVPCPRALAICSRNGGRYAAVVFICRPGGQAAGQHGQLHDCCGRQQYRGSWYSWVGHQSDTVWLYLTKEVYHKQRMRPTLWQLSGVSLMLLAMPPLTTFWPCIIQVVASSSCSAGR